MISTDLSIVKGDRRFFLHQELLVGKLLFQLVGFYTMLFAMEVERTRGQRVPLFDIVEDLLTHIRWRFSLQLTLINAKLAIIHSDQRLERALVERLLIGGLEFSLHLSDDVILEARITAQMHR